MGVILHTHTHHAVQEHTQMRLHVEHLFAVVRRVGEQPVFDGDGARRVADLRVLHIMRPVTRQPFGQIDLRVRRA